MDKIRKLFESYRAGAYLKRWKTTGDYVEDSIECEWQAYQAAYLAGMREAAEICAKNEKTALARAHAICHTTDECDILARIAELEKQK